MARYKVDINGVNTSDLKVLSSEEMKHLFYELKNGKEDARIELINGNLKLVLSMVQRFNGRHDNMDDLFQIGCIGLIKAIDNFDLSHEVKFSTYACPMIIGEIKKYLRDNNSVRISRSIKENAYKIIKEKSKKYYSKKLSPYIKLKSQIMIRNQKNLAKILFSLKNIYRKISPRKFD